MVLVRQLGDGSWFVIGATTETIVLTTPANGARITSVQPLLGEASAFEGHVDVALYADGRGSPIATTFVTGRGDGVLGQFEGGLDFDVPDGATHGTLVLTEPERRGRLHHRGHRRARPLLVLLLPLPSAGELRRLVPIVLAGLVLFGIGIGLMVRAELGLAPWDVLHQGIADRTGLPMGTVTILTGVTVLLGWIPLRERLGLGTVLNALVMPIRHVSGVVVSAGLGPPSAWALMTRRSRRVGAWEQCWPSGRRPAASSVSKLRFETDSSTGSGPTCTGPRWARRCSRPGPCSAC